MLTAGADNNARGRLVRPAYRIATTRLVIRCWNPTDAILLKDAIDANTDHLRPWMPWATKDPAPLEVRLSFARKCRGEFDLGKDFVYGIFDPEEKEVIGGTGLHTRHGNHVREIGYWIQEKHGRKGFASEVAAALTKVAFIVDGVERVEIHCAIENIKSAGIPKKLGFVREAVLRKRHRDADGNLRDMIVWTMMAEEFAHSIPSKAEVQAYDAIGRKLM